MQLNIVKLKLKYCDKNVKGGKIILFAFKLTLIYYICRTVKLCAASVLEFNTYVFRHIVGQRFCQLELICRYRQRGDVPAVDIYIKRLVARMYDFQLLPFGNGN